MDTTTYKEIQQLNRMTVGELQKKHREVFGEVYRSNHKDFLRKRIAWRLQARAEGTLSERAKRRAAELANDADLRIRMPRASITADSDNTVKCTVSSVSQIHNTRLPLPGTLLSREYKGRDIVVKVLTDGFEHENQRYKSLSAIAREVTGTKWNGYLFFGLTKNSRKNAKL